MEYLLSLIQYLNQHMNRNSCIFSRQQLQQGPYQTSGSAEAHFLWAARVQQSPPSPVAPPAPVLPVTLLQTVPALLLQNLPP